MPKLFWFYLGQKKPKYFSLVYLYEVFELEELETG